MMANEAREQAFVKYIEDIKNAKSEQPKKERFLTLLANGAFFGSWAEDFVDQFAKGSEDGIFNIQRKGKKSGLGFADTQYGSVIIEFEDDLKKTGAHAADQLREYLSGKWNSGIQARFTLITTDCLVWKIYSPDYDTLIRLEGSLAADEIVFDEPRTFDVREHTADEFYFFINRYMMAYDVKPATIDEIKLAFGRGGEVYNAAMRGLYKVYAEIKETPEMRTAFEQWEKLLSIAYGRFQGSDELFLIHSYLSALAKIMAYVVITGSEFVDDGTLKSIITGEAFLRHHVTNFTDEDFFRWIAKYIGDKAMIGALRDIACGLEGFNMKSVTDDILKGVYQELVDNDMKHSLGEHYTPDWLCAYVVREMKPKRGQKILDPSCGSGSFLKAAANYLIEQYPDITAEELNDSLYGIDVHPLSVQISKATVLIAIGERIDYVKYNLSLNVFLANTLLLPEKGVNKYLDTGRSRTVTVDNTPISINEEIFKDREAFTKVLNTCNKLSDDDAKLGKPKEFGALEAFFQKRFDTTDDQYLRSVYYIYQIFTETKIAGRDGIWAFILNNSYIPYFLKGSIDMVIGNPPWLTFRDIENGEYQNDVKKVAQRYNVLPKSTNLRAGLELAAIFLAHCLNYFLNKSGKLAFVLPRSFFCAEQHGNIRRGEIENVAITSAWDLFDVTPLFNVPSCVLFAEHRERHWNDKGDLIPIIDEVKSFPGRVFSGKLSDHNAGYDDATGCIKHKDETIFLSEMGKNTTWSMGTLITFGGENAYRNLFKRGATIIPQKCYYIDFDFDKYAKVGLFDREIMVWSCETVQAKRPWDTIKLKGLMHTRFMFETVHANNMVPFALNGTNFMVLPTDSPALHGGRIKLMMPEALMNATGEMTGVDWFKKVRDIWDENKTDISKSRDMDILARLDYSHGISNQKLDIRYVVMYTKSGKNVSSLVLDREASTELPFVANDRSYVFYTNEKDEAYYLTAFLNSSIVNEMIKPFQSRGLMGERDIHTKILDVPLPRYDESNADHRALAELAEAASAKAAAFVKAQNFDRKGNSLGPAALGKFRNDVRDYLKAEMAAMDEILERIIGGMTG